MVRLQVSYVFSSFVCLFVCLCSFSFSILLFSSPSPARCQCIFVSSRSYSSYSNTQCFFDRFIENQNVFVNQFIFFLNS